MSVLEEGQYLDDCEKPRCVDAAAVFERNHRWRIKPGISVPDRPIDTGAQVSRLFRVVLLGEASRDVGALKDPLASPPVESTHPSIDGPIPTRRRPPEIFQLCLGSSCSAGNEDTDRRDRAQASITKPADAPSIPRPLDRTAFAPFSRDTTHTDGLVPVFRFFLGVVCVFSNKRV